MASFFRFFHSVGGRLGPLGPGPPQNEKTEKQISLRTFDKDKKRISLRTFDTKVLILRSKKSSYITYVVLVPGVAAAAV